LRGILELHIPPKTTCGIYRVGLQLSMMIATAKKRRGERVEGAADCGFPADTSDFHLRLHSSVPGISDY